MNNDLEFLDMLAIISFGLQMAMVEQMAHEASNNEVIQHLHSDIMQLNEKLDLILQHLGLDQSETS